MDGWVGEWMDGWMGGWVDGWMGGWMGGWVNGWMDGWTDGRMDEWMDGWTDGWMDRSYVVFNPLLNGGYYTRVCTTGFNNQNLCILLSSVFYVSHDYRNKQQHNQIGLCQGKKLSLLSKEKNF
jgi:hypothetical protein